MGLWKWTAVVTGCVCSDRVDIEAQMTMFAYYYIGIGLGVLIVSYFQVNCALQVSFKQWC